MFGMPAPADLASNLQVCIVPEALSQWCWSCQCKHTCEGVLQSFSNGFQIVSCCVWSPTML